METKEYSVGITRMKYLDLANMSFTQGEFSQCQGHIDSFLETINQDTNVGKQITEQFTQADLKKQQSKKQLYEHIKQFGELEQMDVKNQGEAEILVECLHDKKTICWNLAMKKGLFLE